MSRTIELRAEIFSYKINADAPCPKAAIKIISHRGFIENICKEDDSVNFDCGVGIKGIYEELLDGKNHMYLLDSVDVHCNAVDLRFKYAVTFEEEVLHIGQPEGIFDIKLSVWRGDEKPADFYHIHRKSSAQCLTVDEYRGNILTNLLRCSTRFIGDSRADDGSMSVEIKYTDY